MVRRDTRPMADRQLELIKGVRKRKRGRLEFPLTCQVADLLDLNAKPHWRWTHFPAGELRSEATGARLKRMGLKPGWPDFILVPGEVTALGAPPGLMHCLELKRELGGELSDDQLTFRTWAWDNGIPYKIARTLDRVSAILTEWDVLRLTVRVQ